MAQEKEQKERAQRCFVSYLRSVYLMKNKEVFDVFKLKTYEYALSLGLAVAPRVRFLNKAQTQRAKMETQTPDEQLEEEELRRFKAQLKGTSSQEENQNSESEDSSDDEQSDSQEALKPIRKPSQQSGSEEEGDSDDDDLRDLDLFTVKRKDVFNIQGDDESAEEAEQSKEAQKKNVAKDSKFKEAKKVLKRKFQVNTKVTFNEGGEAVQQWPPVQRLAIAEEEEEDEEEVSGINVEKAKERLRREDQEFDKQEYRRKVKAKHREARLKAKAARREAKKKSGRKSDDDEEEEDEEEVVAYLDKNSDDEFDPSMLPDPDIRHSEDDDNDDKEEGDVRTSKRQYSSQSSDEDEQDMAARNRKRAKQQDDKHTALDTGLSLAEDEELVLHLLGGSR